MELPLKVTNDLARAEKAVDVPTFYPPISLFGGFFVFSMLIALDGLFEAELAIGRGRFPGIHDPGFTKFFIPELWVLGGLAGLTLWLTVKRGELKSSIGAPLLVILAVAIGSAYHVLGKFAAVR